MYHAQGIRSVPSWVAAVMKLRKETKVDGMCEEDDVQQNQDMIDGNSGDNTLSITNCQQQMASPPDGQDSQVIVSNEMKSESSIVDWKHVARTCDKICFALFLGFHVIFSIVVVATLLT